MDFDLIIPFGKFVHDDTISGTNSLTRLIQFHMPPAPSPLLPAAEIPIEDQLMPFNPLKPAKRWSWSTGESQTFAALYLFKGSKDLKDVASNFSGRSNKVIHAKLM
jgi:hypothetical protein